MADATIEIDPIATLVLGGARSGKSRYAEGLLASAPAPVYVATAEPGDAEMAARIKEHRKRRGKSWKTLEVPLDVAGCLRDATGPENPVLVDCLTLWLSNVLAAGLDADAEVAALAFTVGEISGPVILVSNEVGSGIVPENVLARAFRDYAGRMNQRMAEACHRVVLVTAGLPQILKDEEG